MPDEVEIVDRVQVDVAELKSFEDYAAITTAAPLHAVYKHKKAGHQRTEPVLGFTADRAALVLDEATGRLVRARSAAGSSWTLEAVRPAHSIGGPTEARGPFTPAPPGMEAVFSDGSREPIRYFDVYGRPVLIDREPTSRSLYLAQEDEGIAAIEGPADPSSETT